MDNFWAENEQSSNSLTFQNGGDGGGGGGGVTRRRRRRRKWRGIIPY
jgi:hypothetical protein